MSTRVLPSLHVSDFDRSKRVVDDRGWNPQADVLPPTWAERASRWVNLLRYHRPSQFVHRLTARGRRAWLRAGGGRRYLATPENAPRLRPESGLQPILERKLSARHDPASAAKAQAVLAGRFSFLNEEHCLGQPVDWRASRCGQVDALWRFHLHYHEFLLDLLVSEAPVRSDLLWALVTDWMAANRPDDPRVFDDAWHPFCISRRLPVWMMLWQAAPPSLDIADDIARSMAQQATFLAAHLERDIGGNHLIENARCLMLAGCFFCGGDADRWLQLGRRILHAELPIQLLPHGEHFERSPMYHAQMLEGLLDVRDATRARDPELSEFCRAAAFRMAMFLEAILHPDGEIPLFGDSVLGEASRPLALIDAAKTGVPQPPVCLSASRQIGDYWVHRNADSFLVFDGGPVGPDSLPAHAHSDLLTFEATIRGRRAIVDSGVFHYRDDAERRYCRGTAAHNVLQFDNREFCDVWSRFRMGYRGHPMPLETGRWGDFDWVRGRHNAGRRLGAPWVGRWIACRPDGPWLIVDWADGTGTHQLANYLHLHPETRVNTAGENEVIACMGDARICIRPLAPGQLEVIEGWYCPRFGSKQVAPVVRWRCDTCLPVGCGWEISWNGTKGAAALDSHTGTGLTLRWTGIGVKESYHCDPSQIRGHLPEE